MAESQPRSANYTLGHDSVTLHAHNARTAKVAADYLLPHIQSDDQILDIGCGPGSITVGLAERAPNGRTIGIDYSPKAIEAAKKAIEAKGAPKNIEFRIGNAFDLDWKEETFDVVHAHQCLIHLADPVQALREMKRVCKTQKVVGVREADFGGFIIYPEIPLILKTFDIWTRVIRSGGSEPNAGRQLLAWARKAGFQREHIQVTATVGVYATHTRKQVIADRFAVGIMHSEVGTKAVELGLTTKEEIENIVDAWKKWVNDENAYFGLANTEILCWKE